MSDDYKAALQEAAVKEAIDEERQAEATAWKELFGDQGICEVADELASLRALNEELVATLGRIAERLDQWERVAPAMMNITHRRISRGALGSLSSVAKSALSKARAKGGSHG